MIRLKTCQRVFVFSDGSMVLNTNPFKNKKITVLCLSKDFKNYQTQYKKKELNTSTKTSNIENYRKQLFK